MVFSCDSNSRYRFNRASDSISQLPLETFIFWIRDNKFETNLSLEKRDLSRELQVCFRTHLRTLEWI